MRMSQFFYLFLIFLLVAVGLVPFIDGYLFKRDFFTFIEIINQRQSSSNFKLEVSEYRLGWAHSQAKVRLIPSKDMVPIMQGITIDYDIAHGPYAYDPIENKRVMAYAIVKSDMVASPKWQNLLLNKNNKSLIQTYSRVNFDGDWYQQIHIAPLVIPDLGIFRMEPSKGIIKFNVKDNRINGMEVNGNIGAITLDFDRGISHSGMQQIHIQASTYQHHSIFETSGLWNVQTKIAIPTLSIQETSGQTLSMTNLELFGSANLDKENATSKIQISFKTLSLPTSLITMISQFNFSISANYFNGQAVKAYFDFVKSHEVMTDNDRKLMENMFFQMISPKSTVNADFAFSSSLGNFSLQSKLFWQTNAPAPMSVSDLALNVRSEANIRAAILLVNTIIEKTITKFDELAAKIQLHSQSEPRLSVTSQNNMMTHSGEQNTTEMDAFKQQVAMLLQQGKISLPASLALLEAADQRLSMEAFTTKVNALVPQDVSMQLIQNYQEQLNKIKNKSALQTLSPAEQPQSAVLQSSVSPPTSPPLTPADRTQQVINDWLQKGYIIKDNEDYVLSITAGGGVIKVNGKEMNPALPGMINMNSVIEP